MGGGPDTGLHTRVKFGMTIQHRLDNHQEFPMYGFWAYGVFGPKCRIGDFDKITPDGGAANERAAKSGDSGRILRLFMNCRGGRIGEKKVPFSPVIVDINAIPPCKLLDTGFYSVQMISKNIMCAILIKKNLYSIAHC